MLYIGYLIILNGQNIKKIGSIFELPRVENCINRLCPSPSHNFGAFGGLIARATWA